jgi:hypothetical protein
MSITGHRARRVRVAFVLLTLLGGLGLTMYGLGWLLLSQLDSPIGLIVWRVAGHRRHHQYQGC